MRVCVSCVLGWRVCCWWKVDDVKGCKAMVTELSQWASARVLAVC